MKAIKLFLLVGIMAYSCNAFTQKPKIDCPYNKSREVKDKSKGKDVNIDKIKFPKGFYDTLKVYSNKIGNIIYEREKSRTEFLKKLIEDNCKNPDSIIIIFCDYEKNSFIKESLFRKNFEDYLSIYLTKKRFISFSSRKWRERRRINKLRKRNLSPCLPDQELFDKGCVEEWKKYKDILCAKQIAFITKCDTCEIIKEYCKREGKEFNKEKCKCKLVKQDAADIIDKIKKENKPPCTNITLEVRRTNKGQDIWVALYYNNPTKKDTCIGGGDIIKIGYDTAKYDLPNTLKVYLHRFCKNMFNMFERQEWPENSARVNIVGMADGLQIDPYIKYIGYENLKIKVPVKMRKKDYLIIEDYDNKSECGHKNKEDYVFDANKEKQNKITDNIQLAYLRAYPIRQIVNESFQKLDNLGIYTIAAPESGREFRRIEVYMLIKEATLKTGGGEQIRNVWLERMRKCGEK